MSAFKPMNIVFAGTPEFAATALSAILDAGHRVPLVLTQPDRPAGRGMQMSPGAVKKVALRAGIEVFQPLSLKRDPEAVARLSAIAHDVMVVAAYGLILPQAVLDIPKRGCLNIHASLLPRWRGAAPIQRAIEAGDAHTGICVMRMEAGLDTGPVLLRASLAIGDDDSAATLHDRLSALGARLIVDALGRLDALHEELQSGAGVTYASKIEKSEASLDFRLPAQVLARKVRAFDAVPGATASINGVTIKVLAARAVANALHADAGAGTVLASDPGGIAVACGDGNALLITELQKPGGKRLPARDFIQGFAVAAGSRFALPDGGAID